ncbi:hypothetical protein ON003_02670 [Janibacter hoylei]|uniref:hypothetical protein n=1 Tax=Janibacter hoylei TaxID=364298 RepID=UPI002238D716|nr:hypothetical protein [Janibacter hoylei]MCW4600629.1 hypothetical protein [Janibacter hoylei]
MLTPLHAGVLGSPIDHSLSPTLHRAGYEATGLADWRYTAHEVDEGGLAPSSPASTSCGAGSA